MRPARCFILAATAFLALAPPATASGQAVDRLLLSAPGGASREITLVRHRGYPAVGASALASAGWTLVREGEGYAATLPGGLRMEIHPGAPFVLLEGTWAQLVASPYELGDSLFLPVQLLTDLLPDRLPAHYAARGSLGLLVRQDSLWEAGTSVAGSRPGGSTPGEMARPLDPRDDGIRVVVIDPGHGGVDPGSLGGGRTREKDVTLAVGLALAEVLKGEPGLEVHLTRDSDVLVPIWERGEIATRLKGDRYGIFLSIHANAVTRRDVRGVETYFLSEARTEHEARVAALENSAMELERGRPSGPAQGELGAIISELLNLDFQHWSADLAGGIHEELARVHPGPDRGVKQAPLAVLTNAMMPSVLIEVGFITHPEEERLIADPDFHRDVAEAVAEGVKEFFQRYPPRGAQGRSQR
ncbi:MAG TPA: N-acetylmuramoyl-L-alanine amidase [Longimicrobiales bacterium]|nr:N-acetylmuramoyl-L-alanine amidase [Longimicrobiales bacterium]